MVKYKTHTAYLWYCDQKSKEALELPDLDPPDVRGYTALFYGELFCRVANCPKDTPATSTNNLRKHYDTKHPQIQLTGSSGRPNMAEEQEAVDWYIKLRDDYDERLATAANIKPAVPRKADGTIHLTNMRKQAEDRGGQVPCEPCKDAKDNGCCREEHVNRCDNFDLFLPVDEDDDDDT